MIKAIACSYSFINTHILIGEVTEERVLVVEREMIKENCSVQEIADFLISFDLSIYIPCNGFLEEHLFGRCEIIGIDEEEEPQLEDFLMSLQHENRIALKEGVELRGTRAQTVLKMLLKVFSKYLAAPDDFEFQSTGRRESSNLSDYVEGAAIHPLFSDADNWRVRPW